MKASFFHFSLLELLTPTLAGACTIKNNILISYMKVAFTYKKLIVSEIFSEIGDHLKCPKKGFFLLKTKMDYFVKCF